MADKNKLSPKVSALSTTFFFLGLFSLVSQTMIIREFLTVVYGNEIILGVLFFHWLAGIFAGALCGGPAADRSKHPALLFVISILSMCLLLPLCLTGIRFLYTISGTAAGNYVGFFKVFFLSGIFIIPLVFCIGFSFPLTARMQSETDSHRLEKVRTISNIYILEAAGFLFGGIAYTFFLAGKFNPFFIAGLVTLPLLFHAALLPVRSRSYKTLSFTILLLLLSSIILIPTVNRKIDHVTAAGRWQGVSPAPLIYSTDSKYQHIAVAKLFNQYYLYLNNMYSAVFPEQDENMILAAHLFCQHPAPKRVLIIGDALSGLAKYLLNYDIETIVSVEIDPMVVETMLRFLPEEEKKILRDPRFQIEFMDGRKYVKALTGKPPSFDIVFLNVPEPATLLLNRFYTKDFFLDLSKILTEEGVAAFKITSSETYGKGLVSDYTASLFGTAAEVFPEIVVTPGVQNFIFASRSKESSSDDPAILARRYEASGAKPEKLGRIFYSLYPEDKTTFIKKTLAGSATRRINRDDHPNANFYFSKITGWYAGSNLGGILDFFERLKIKALLLFLFALFIMRAIYITCKRKKSSHCCINPGMPGSRVRFLETHTLLSVFCCGMAGLSLELVIIYIFQNVFGYVYHMIGFIIALFMTGLPAGAYLANIFVLRKTLPAHLPPAAGGSFKKPPPDPTKFLFKRRFKRDKTLEKTKPATTAGIIKLMMVVQLCLAALSLFISRVDKFFMNSFLITEIMIFSVTILTGFAVGMMFPLSLHIYLILGGKTGKSAGIVNAYDHLGAAVGALFVGTLFLPLLGVFNVCLFTALFLLASSALLALDLFASRSRPEKG